MWALLLFRSAVPRTTVLPNTRVPLQCVRKPWPSTDMQLRKRKAHSKASEGSEAKPQAEGRPHEVAARGLQSAGPAAGAPAAAPADPASDAGPKQRCKKPPQDIGIPQLLLGRGMPPAPAEAAAAVDAVDRLPLGAAGFTPQTLQAACDFLAKADPSQ
jgi:hypothetical protein